MSDALKNPAGSVQTDEKGQYSYITVQLTVPEAIATCIEIINSAWFNLNTEVCNTYVRMTIDNMTVYLASSTRDSVFLWGFPAARTTRPIQPPGHSRLV